MWEGFKRFIFMLKVLPVSEVEEQEEVEERTFEEIKIIELVVGLKYLRSFVPFYESLLLKVHHPKLTFMSVLCIGIQP